MQSGFHFSLYGSIYSMASNVICKQLQQSKLTVLKLGSICLQ